MSSDGSESASGGDSRPGRREVAHRLFATEFDTSSLEYADSDEERAPKYVITPTGARVNRLFAVGVLTEVQRVNDEVVRARVVDPTGAFVVYAGQYQPDALAFLERADPPMFVAVTGKANTFRPEDSDRVYTSVRPESIAEVNAETRDRWTVQAAEHTLRRIGEFAAALETDSEASDRRNGIALAREEYGTTPAYLAALRETALDAARLVAGAVEEVTPPAIEPGADDGRVVDLADLRDTEASEPTSVAGAGAEEGAPTADATAAESEPGTAADIESEPEPDATGFETPEQKSEDGTAEAPAEASGTTDDADGEATGVPETATAEAESDERSDSDDLGDFDVPESEPAASEPVAEGDAETADEGELYEFDAEERAEIEAEFDMEFSSGSEVDDPGEADIDVPEPEGGAESEDGGPNMEVDTTDEPNDEGEVDVEDRAMEVMRDLADGDGADREAVIERVASEAGVAPEEVDEAIDSALLSGRCYEPQDDVLKPI